MFEKKQQRGEFSATQFASNHSRWTLGHGGGSKPIKKPLVGGDWKIFTTQKIPILKEMVYHYLLHPIILLWLSHHIRNVTIPTDEVYIFQDGYCTTNQLYLAIFGGNNHPKIPAILSYLGTTRLLTVSQKKSPRWGPVMLGTRSWYTAMKYHYFILFSYSISPLKLCHHS